MSAGVRTTPASTSWSTNLSPSPSTSIARRPAKCSSACLRWAGQKRPPEQRSTASSCAFGHGRAALRALVRHVEPIGLRARARRLHARDLGDDVARAPHDHGVALPDVLAADLVLVVQGRVRHGRAADEHGLQARHRRERPGAAHLDVDVLDLGGRFLGGELVRHSPARRARDEAEMASGRRTN